MFFFFTSFLWTYQGKQMQDVFGILLMFTGAASGLLFQDPVVCRFTQTNQCYVALGQQLHLKMPLEERLDLQFINETSGAHRILRYRKADSLPPRPLLPWQFVNDNKTLILSSVERNNSGKYTLFTFDANGNTKGDYNLQLIIEAKVSSVKVSCSCLATEVMKVDCSADGDNLRFTWTSDSNTFLQLKNGTRSFELVKDHHGSVTCHVENHVSHETDTTELCSCPGFMVFVSVWLFEVIILLSLLVGAFYIYTRIYRKQRITEFSVDEFLDGGEQPWTDSSVPDPGLQSFLIQICGRKCHSCDQCTDISMEASHILV
ncbi:uncharacterized protein LOC132869019 [Neoarius graeffei]|uniref:uncharacterized protein LOC132869019 n=1 Tax=Neoarius graeffei TaxID=443677 RepID=UPI00298D1FDE|nr:uncharacterized protein LOC132869019 [Neoarius graeffei]